MAKNEIKLRKQLVDENALQRHRNYSLLLQKHYRQQRKKRSRKIFMYSIMIAVITVLLLIIVSYLMVKWERERELKEQQKSNQQTELKP